MDDPSTAHAAEVRSMQHIPSRRGSWTSKHSICCRSSSLGIVAILFAGWLAKDVMSRDQGTPEMQKISDASSRARSPT